MTKTRMDLSDRFSNVQFRSVEVYCHHIQKGRSYWPGTPRLRHDQHAVRAAIQQSKAAVSEIAEQYGLNEKTVCKWRERSTVQDAPTGPKDPRTAVLSPEDEAIFVAFRRHMALPQDDGLYALQETVPQHIRSSLHRLYRRHEISRLPDLKGAAEPKKKFKSDPIG
ncbi:MAG: hypothetical protein AAGC92_08265 [Pseudomonadota bacterium]